MCVGESEREKTCVRERVKQWEREKERERERKRKRVCVLLTIRPQDLFICNDNRPTDGLSGY